MTPTYQLAVQSIRAHVDAEQTRLDAAASTARAAHLAALRTNTLSPSDPLYPLAALIIQTVAVGREDGYPKVEIPAETAAAIRAAHKAGMVPKTDGQLHLGPWECCSDASGLTLCSTHLWNDDYNAWAAANKYRKSQTIATL